MKRFFFVFLMVVLAGRMAPGESLNVVATVGMIADVARTVAGEEATVSLLIGEGIDPHMYKPTRHDVLALTRSDVVFYNGLMLEGKMADTLGKLGRQGKPVVAVSEKLARSRLLDDSGSGHSDPHVWMDVALWAQTVDEIVSVLSAARPASASLFASRAADYRNRLLTLDAYVRHTLATVPPERRVLITAHDAFNYFGRAYGLEVLGIQGLSTESEAGLNDINRLVDLIVARGIAAIFVESSVADKNVKALIEGARSRGHEVVIGGTLYSDAMGAPGTYEGTYIGMIEHNANTIASALGGRVPEGGFPAWAKQSAP